MPACATFVLFSMLVSTSLYAAPPDRVLTPARESALDTRVRPADDRSATVLRRGLLGSQTLRALVERVENSDVVVYIEMRPGMPPDQAGGVAFVSAAGRFRYLRIRLNPALSGQELAATLGHELRHVVEIVDDPDVRDERSMSAMYARIGTPSRILRGLGWETIEAQIAGTQVRRELATPSTAAADGQGQV